MQILIEIPEEQKKMIDGFMELPPQIENDLISAIRHGTPLPEHHGRLIDADALKQRIAKVFPMVYGGVASEIDNTETIIPATKEKSCKNCVHGFDSEDCYKCDKNIQNTCEPKQTATKEGAE